MAGEGRLDIAGIPGPVNALLLLRQQSGVAVNTWWNGGVNFVADGSLTVAGGNTLACYQESLAASWIADLPAGLPLGTYRFYFWAGTPNLATTPLGWNDFDYSPAQPVGAGGIHYFIDWTAKSFWPVIFPSNVQPTAMLRYAYNASQPAQVILAGQDGYLRTYSASYTTDDGTPFTSLVTYGPLRPGGPGYYGQITQIAADMDTHGQPATWSIYGSQTAEGAVAAAIAGNPSWTGTLAPGLSHRAYPRAVGAALAITLSGTYGWAAEAIRIEGRARGPIR
jgi:hypothetical protein